jgi:hypothetical protein
MLTETEQQRFEKVCQEHIWAAVGMYVLYQASGSESDAESAAVSVRELVDVAPAYRICWDRLKPIVQTQGFRSFIAIVEHDMSPGTKQAKPARDRVVSTTDPEFACHVLGPQEGELAAERLLSIDSPRNRKPAQPARRKAGTPAAAPARASTADTAGQPRTALPLARLRVLEGEFSGRELDLSKVVTQFGKPGRHVAAILRHKDGYSLVSTQETPRDEAPLINGKRIGTEARTLRHDDIVQIAGIKARFVLN